MQAHRKSTRAQFWVAMAASVSALALLLHALDLRAQDFPSKPLRFLVPFPPGGVGDTVGLCTSRVMPAKSSLATPGSTPPTGSARSPEPEYRGR